MRLRAAAVAILTAGLALVGTGVASAAESPTFIVAPGAANTFFAFTGDAVVASGGGAVFAFDSGA
ncbi:hypothetical protein [Saccharopolyspora oryzae]|uniref:Uncharacterized protein n=1 Tax=Saccharopolyspora oryzae TaxID=2997343 RepID=A0ABT4V7Z1_9PSEU|nr:hypothetical protein [Saccharopolyspora oryzae]MDA3630097.1 hypothetical protein [Saccharopolyspora oryzae]